MTDIERKSSGARSDDSGTLLGRYVPFEALVNQHDVLTRGGDLIRSWRLDALCGAAESVASGPLERHAAFCQLLGQLAGGRYAVWTHRIRRRAGGEGSLQTAALLEEVYFTVLVRSVPRRSPRFLRIPKKAIRNAQGSSAELSNAMQQISSVVSTALGELRPHLLGGYCIGARAHSEVLDFLGLLVNGFWEPQRLNPTLLHRSLSRAQVAFEGEKIVFRHGCDTRYAVALRLTDSVDALARGAKHICLPMDCEFIETQSFSPGFERLQEGNEVVSQQRQVSGQVMGDYHHSLVMFGADAKQAEHRAAAAAYGIGAVTGIAMTVCDMSDAVWFSQWPGTWSWRARQARLSSRTFGMASPYQAVPDSA